MNISRVLFEDNRIVIKQACSIVDFIIAYYQVKSGQQQAFCKMILSGRAVRSIESTLEERSFGQKSEDKCTGKIFLLQYFTDAL